MIELSFPYCLLMRDLILHINYYVGLSYYDVVFPIILWEIDAQIKIDCLMYCEDD